ncbi:MAG: hypothetical protein QXT86_09880 [Archaeoglobaceae archaeon]
MNKCKKNEYEELFNKVFGVQVKWSRLSCEELIQIATVLFNPGDLIRRLKSISPETRTKEEKIIEGIKLMIEGIDRKGPIISTLKRLLGGENATERENNIV